MECYILGGVFTLLAVLLIYALYKLGKCWVRDIMAYIIQRVLNDDIFGGGGSLSNLYYDVRDVYNAKNELHKRLVKLETLLDNRKKK